MVALFMAARFPLLTAILYQGALAALVALLWSRRLVWILAAAAVVGYGLCYPALDRRSLCFSYASIQGLEDPEVLYSVNTFYQRVDILSDASFQRQIYLSGRLNYGTQGLRRFNVALAQLPAMLLRPAEALIVGSGSMASVWRVSPNAGHVTTVELDEAVVAGSRSFLAEVNHLDKVKNWTLVINDAKNFLGSTPRRFDLIVMDVPAPTTIQLGLLHSVEFYRLARGRLAPGGAISVSLSGIFDKSQETPITVTAALLKAFPKVIVYTSDDAGRSFALAGEDLRFSIEDLRNVAARLGLGELKVYEQKQLEEIVGDSPPMSADDMRHVVRKSWEHLHDMFSSEGSD